VVEVGVVAVAVMVLTPTPIPEVGVSLVSQPLRINTRSKRRGPVKGVDLTVNPITRSGNRVPEGLVRIRPLGEEASLLQSRNTPLTAEEDETRALARTFWR